MIKNPVSAEGYFLKQHKLCRPLLSVYTRKKEAEDLHQLRVSIKKIKAILLMLDKLEGNFGFDKTFAPYKILFKQLAPIRNEMLQAEKTKNEPVSTQQKNKHRLRIAAYNKKLKQAAPGYLKSITEKLPETLQYLSKVKHKDIYPYCKKLLRKIKANWKDIKTDDELHKYRKQLKQLLYCSSLLTSKQKDKLLSSKEHKRIDKLQDEIGQWHDNILLLTEIEKGTFKVSPTFQQTIKKETELMIKEIRKKGDKL